DSGLLLFALDVQQHYFLFGHLFDRRPEIYLDLARIHTIIHVHLVSELQVSLEIRSNNQCNFVVPDKGNGITVSLEAAQIDRSFYGGVPCPEDDAFRSRIVIGVLEFVFDPVIESLTETRFIELYATLGTELLGFSARTAAAHTMSQR